MNLKNSLYLNSFLVKKRKPFLLFSFLCLSLFFRSQNIANYINNGGFEQNYNCIVPSILSVKYWRNIDSSQSTSSALYSNICISNVPNNGLTYQWPHSGQGYAMASLLCQPPQCNPNANRHYIRNRLKNNLISGKTYCVKLYVNVSNPTSYGISNVGLFFVDNSIDTITKSSTPLTYITPQVENSTSNVLTDTMNWVIITGTFVANGSEKNCVIGNFKSDAATTKTLINTSILPTIGCDILIDDVSCIPLDLTAYAAPSNDIWAIPGNTIYLGRPQDVGIDEACEWFKLPNTTTAIDTAAGITVTVALTTNTYMVKQDICGVIKYDTVVVHASAVGLNELKIKDEGLKIFPNPTNDKLNIEFTIKDLDKEFTKAEIINNIGQLVKVIALNYNDNTAQINTTELQAGVYHLLIKSQTQSINRRFVVAR